MSLPAGISVMLMGPIDPQMPVKSAITVLSSTSLGSAGANVKSSIFAWTLRGKSALLIHAWSKGADFEVDVVDQLLDDHLVDDPDLGI